MVTKQQQLEWLAKNLDSWHEDGDRVCVVGFDNGYADPYFPVVHPHGIRKREWQQEREKMQKEQDNSWHERGEFPPVGCECEAFADGCEPEACTILAIHNGDAAVKWSKFNDGGLDVIALNCWSFRPLRTEREKAIEEMANLIAKSVFGSAKCQAEKLYDAGYRKVELRPSPI